MASGPSPNTFPTLGSSAQTHEQIRCDGRAAKACVSIPKSSTEPQHCHQHSMSILCKMPSSLGSAPRLPQGHHAPAFGFLSTILRVGCGALPALIHSSGHFPQASNPIPSVY